MATISSVGIGSGLDVNSIVSQLVALEKQPLKTLALQATNITNQVSAMGDIHSKFSALSDVATRISDPSAWAARNANSSNTSAATIAVTSSAAATSFTLDVDALATKQSTSSPAILAGGYVGAGTMTFRLGTWTGASSNAGADNAGVANADLALPAAQAALTTAQTNLTSANTTLGAANTTLTATTSAYNTALADSTNANATLSSATTGYNAAVTACNQAEATRVVSESTLATATTTSTNATTAAAAAQTALDSTTAAAGGNIAAAQSGYDASVTAFNSATAAVGAAQSDSTAANAAWATASTTATNANTVLTTANSALAAGTSGLSSANATLATANTALATVNSQFALASAAITSAGVASASLQDHQSAADGLASYAAAYTGAGSAQLGTYATAYNDWVTSIAANDHLTPGLQTSEDTARAAMVSARSALASADPTALNAAYAITAPADATNASLLKGQAVVAATAAGTTLAGVASNYATVQTSQAAALATQTAAAAAAAAATGTYNSAVAAQTNAAAAAATANADLGTAASDKTTKAAALLAANVALAAASTDKDTKSALLATANGAVASATATRDATAATAATAITSLAAAQADRDTATADAATASSAVTIADTAKISALADASAKAGVLATATTDQTAATTAVTNATTAVTNATTAVTNATTAVTNATSGISSSRPAFAAASSNTDVSITTTATDTVATLAAKINAANAGVVATAFFDGTQDRLQLTSASTGAAAGYRVQVADTGDGNNTDNFGLSRFAYDPQTSAFGMASSGVTATYGQDAKARINGLAVTSSTNTLSNNIPGVTISLKATTTTGYGTGSEVKNSATMTVSEDVTVAVKNINDFVTAYNDLNKVLADNTKYDAATKTSSLFQGDSTVVSMQNVLRSMEQSITTGSAYQNLSSIGVERQLDGSLTMNTAKLSTAANNGTELAKLFTINNSNTVTNGFALKFAAFAKGALATSGVVSNKEKALTAKMTANTTAQTKVNDRATAVEARLRKTYSALDGQMASLNALSSYVSQQVTTWNKSTA